MRALVTTHNVAAADALRLPLVGGEVPMERGSSFAQALNQRHKALDLTQQQLAEQVGYAAMTIQRLEQSTLPGFRASAAPLQI